ncbi:hypothetical protein TrRE_jg6822 [Triparma retinervis]|uniref:WW domain-containing protein n=1 Tax=Triparma retinervis TaxID=2557542 RepID=A0A9W7DKC6_9STRA|nr:hypothetical protein TrRE_jg6822 [Triparma retinervis]
MINPRTGIIEEHEQKLLREMGAGATTMAGDLASGEPKESNPPDDVAPSMSSVQSLGKRLIAKSHYSGLDNLLREVEERTKGVRGGEIMELMGGLLEEAAGKGSLDCMELLLQHVDLGGGVGRGASVVAYPLHRAAGALQTDAVEILLLSGSVKPGDKDVWGKSPLHMALEGGREGVEEGEEGESREVIVATLLHRCPGLLTEKDKGGNEPLHLAAKRGFGGMVGFLMSKGAKDSNRNRNKAGKTASECAREGGHSELGKAMRKGTVGFVGRRKAKSTGGSARGGTSKMDVEKAMLIWEKFFENSMRRQSLRSRDDWEVGRRGVNGSGHNAGRSTSKEHMQYARQVRQETARRVREEKAEKRRLLEIKRRKNLERLGDRSGGRAVELTRTASWRKEGQKEGKRAVAASAPKVEERVEVVEQTVKTVSTLPRDVFWQRVQDNDRNLVYYHDPENGSSVWEEPSYGIISEYIVIWDEEEGRDYYYFDKEGRSDWTLDMEEAGDEAKEEKETAGVRVMVAEVKEDESDMEVTTGKALGIQSLAHIDPRSRIDRAVSSWAGWVEEGGAGPLTYYHNTLTLESMWEQPRGEFVLVRDEENDAYYWRFDNEASWDLYGWRHVKEMLNADEGGGDFVYWWNEQTQEARWTIGWEDMRM